MKGQIVRIVSQKAFGFIRAGDKEYFFHKDEFDGHWTDLSDDVNKHGATPECEFEIVVPVPVKGPRATKVRRLDYPNVG